MHDQIPPDLSEDSAPILRPRPRRPFELSTTSTPSSVPGTPSEPTFLDPRRLGNESQDDGSSTPSRTRSILNLTSSTLFGIYSPTGYATDREEPSTPWGTGAETPVDSRHNSFDVSRPDIPDISLRNGPNGLAKRRRSTVTQRHMHHKPRKSFASYYLPLIGRVTALFGVGVLYGVLISQLHDRQEIAPVKVEGINHSAWHYLAFWGIAGVVLGQALPYFDTLWSAPLDSDIEDEEEEQQQQQRRQRGNGGWNDVVRSIGAFVGVAFAIRKLPWQSTLQLSLTLALSNPAIWYLIDRTPPGLVLSSAISVTGTAILLGISPELVPGPSPAQLLQGHVSRHSGLNATTKSVPTQDLVAGIFSQESVGVATWIASVLFVSCVCFGNIGRRLAPSKTL